MEQQIASSLSLWRFGCFTWNIVLCRLKAGNVFHVKLRTGWLSCGGWFLRTVFPPIVAEELVFHVKPENSRKFFLTVGGMRFDFSVGHNA